MRDEFQFRCVYCLCRERWCPDGEDPFSVEHFRPQAWAAAEVCDYDNLLYTCVQRNALAEGKYPGTNHEREGIVVRPRHETISATLKGRLSFKVISNRFLLRAGE